MKFLQNVVKIEAMKSLVFGGRGGMEQQCMSIFTGCRRVHNPLFDYEIEHNGITYKFELKRQQNTQWFDVGKYTNLSKDEKQIIVIFLMHNGKAAEYLAAITLENFLSLMMNDPEGQSDGWTGEVFDTGSRFKTKYPSLQFKAKANIRQIVKRYPSRFVVIHAA